MKFLYSFFFTLALGSGFSQSKLKDDFSMGMIFEGGIHFENKTKMPLQPYRMDLLENSLKMGGYFQFGPRLTFRDKIYIQFSPFVKTQTRNIDDFRSEVLAMHPDHYTYLRAPSGFVGLFGLQFSAGYTFHTKHLDFAPYISGGIADLGSDYYSYIIREAGNNQIEEYRVASKTNAEVPLSIGIEASHPKIKYLQLVFNFSFANRYKAFTVRYLDQIDYNNSATLHTYEIKKPRLTFSVGLRLNANNAFSNQP